MEVPRCSNDIERYVSGLREGHGMLGEVGWVVMDGLTYRGG